ERPDCAGIGRIVTDEEVDDDTVRGHGQRAATAVVQDPRGRESHGDRLAARHGCLIELPGVRAGLVPVPQLRVDRAGADGSSNGPLQGQGYWGSLAGDGAPGWWSPSEKGDDPASPGFDPPPTPTPARRHRYTARRGHGPQDDQGDAAGPEPRLLR